MHLREHQHEEPHIIATRCMYFSSLFLFFSVKMTETTLVNTVLSPDCDGKCSENAYFWGHRRHLQRAPLTSRGGPISSASILLQSSILIEFYHIIIDTD